MDPTYDSLNAKTRLSELMKERTQSEHSGLQLTRIKQDPSWISSFQPIYGGEPRLWRLTRADGAGGVEEVVASIQGIICKKDMPPFEERISPFSKHIRHLRQGVSITGLGLDDFQNQLDMIPDIAALFTRAISEDKIQPNTIIGEKDAQTAKELAFPHDVDPRGNLARLLGSAHVHIEENTVSYYERVASADTKYVSIKPGYVGVGDLVELQVSFIMVPLRDNNFKATMVLRSILVLDRTYTQKAAAMRFAQQRTTKTAKQAEGLKRRVGYFEEELNTTRAKLNTMQVDESDNSEHQHTNVGGAGPEL